MAALGGASGKHCLYCIAVAKVGISLSASNENKTLKGPTSGAQSGM